MIQIYQKFHEISPGLCGLVGWSIIQPTKGWRGHGFDSIPVGASTWVVGFHPLLGHMGGYGPSVFLSCISIYLYLSISLALYLSSSLSVSPSFFSLPSLKTIFLNVLKGR